MSLVIQGYVSMSLVIRGYVSICLVIRGYVSMSLVIRGSVSMSGPTRICMAAMSVVTQQRHLSVTWSSTTLITESLAVAPDFSHKGQTYTMATALNVHCKGMRKQSTWPRRWQASVNRTFQVRIYGGGGLPPPLAYDVGFLTLGPKLPPPFFACSLKLTLYFSDFDVTFIKVHWKIDPY